MELNVAEQKHQAHVMIDQLGPERLAAVVHLLEALMDAEGETLSPAEAKAIAEASAWSRNNHPIPHERVLAEFGLTPADWENVSLER